MPGPEAPSRLLAASLVQTAASARGSATAPKWVRPSSRLAMAPSRKSETSATDATTRRRRQAARPFSSPAMAAGRKARRIVNRLGTPSVGGDGSPAGLAPVAPGRGIMPRCQSTMSETPSSQVRDDVAGGRRTADQRATSIETAQTRSHRRSEHRSAGNCWPSCCQRTIDARRKVIHASGFVIFADKQLSAAAVHSATSAVRSSA